MLRSFCATVCLLALTGNAAAQEPPPTSSSVASTRLLPAAGVLTDAGGVPLTGAVVVTFTLHATQDDSETLWTETLTVTADDHGRYHTLLGAVTPLPQGLFQQEQARWLGIEAAGHELPRVMLVAVPYALKAMDAETLGGQPADRFLVAGPDGRPQTAGGTDLSGTAVDGTGVTNQLAKWVGGTTLSSSIITETPANQVGIGTADPTEGGAIDSKLTIRTNDGSTALAVSNQAGTPRFALNVNGDGSWITYDRATGSFLPGIAQRGGRVGVATTDPTGGGVVDAKFAVRNLDNNTGIAVLNQSNARRFALNTLANGSFTFYDGVGGTWTQGLIQYNGNLGLGTTTPTTRIFAVGTSTAIVGNSSSARGLEGQSTSSYGVIGFSNSGAAILGQSTGTAPAGQFNGNVNVTGTLTKGGGAFKIDHPLDPANKYLQHSFVESPDMMNVYNGNAMLDASGEAWVTLPDWFQALNRDFRYQLTSIGSQASPYIAVEVADNTFKIAGGTPNGKVSWQVTGIRQDAWANANRIVVEEDKPASERGMYLHPDSLGLSSTMAIPTLAVQPTPASVDAPAGARRQNP